MSDLILLPSIYEGSRDLKDKSKKLVFQTNEITPLQASSLQVCVQQFVYLGIKLEPFSKEQVDFITDLQTDFEQFGKSHSVRLRAVLYKLWEQNSEGYADFNLYYAFRMEALITHFKGKLV